MTENVAYQASGVAKSSKLHKLKQTDGGDVAACTAAELNMATKTPVEEVPVKQRCYRRACVEIWAGLPDAPPPDTGKNNKNKTPAKPAAKAETKSKAKSENPAKKSKADEKAAEAAAAEKLIPKTYSVDVEPEQMFSVVAFTSTAASDGIRRVYVSLKTPVGWQTAKRTGRIKSPCTWDQLKQHIEPDSYFVFDSVAAIMPEQSA